MTQEIKPCPFCGSTEFRVWGGYVECDNDECCALGPNGKTHEESIKLWNRRPALDASKRELDTEAVLKAALGQKYAPPTEKKSYDWLSPTSADRADLESGDEA